MEKRRELQIRQIVGLGSRTVSVSMLILYRTANLIVTCPICTGSFKNSLVALHIEKCNGVPPASAAAWGKLMNGGAASQAAGNECVVSG